MKKSIPALLLAAALTLTLCACGQQSGSLSKGTWTQLEGETDLQSYSTQTLQDAIPGDWTLPTDFIVGEKTRLSISGDKVLYGEIADGGYMDGFTVAQYAGGTLTTVYEFTDGVVRSWQQFFSPDGSKLAVAWTDAQESEDWRLTLVDLATGEESKLEVPEITFTVSQSDENGETQEVTEGPEFLLVKWQDDGNLIVTGSLGDFSASDTASQPQTWQYTLPLES